MTTIETATTPDRKIQHERVLGLKRPPDIDCPGELLHAGMHGVLVWQRGNHCKAPLYRGLLPNQVQKS